MKSNQDNTKYFGASEKGKEFLLEMGVDRGWDGDFNEAVNKFHPDLLTDSYRFSAAKALWRIGKQTNEIRDAITSIYYLLKWLEWVSSGSPATIVLLIVKWRLKKRIKKTLKKLRDRYDNDLDPTTRSLADFELTYDWITQKHSQS